MENRIGTAGNSRDPHLSSVRVKQCQDLGGTIANVFMRMLTGFAFQLPSMACIWNGLERSSFILGPCAQTERLSEAIGTLDQVFFASVSGSVTWTTFPLRLRGTVPVLHQVRSFCQVQPASCNTHQMV